MRLKPILTGLVALGLLLGPGTAAIAQEGEPSEEAYAALMPGDHHKHLEPYAGAWIVELKIWQTPGADPMVMSATSEFEWILDGHYMAEHMAGEMMVENMAGEMMGMPFEGMSLFGYDAFRQEHVSLWVDNMSTALMTSKGACDAEKMVTVMEGTMDDATTGEKDKWYKSVTGMPNDGTFTMEMWMKDPDGKEFRNMLATYTRKDS